MARTTYYVGGAPQFVAHRDTLQQTQGKQIDWANVTASSIPAGTIMCALASGKICPRAEAPGAETATEILLTDANENDDAASLSGYATIVGGVIFSNWLPEAAEVDFDTWIGELEAVGVGNFSWQTAGDNTA